MRNQETEPGQSLKPLIRTKQVSVQNPAKGEKTVGGKEVGSSHNVPRR